jgi:hypothetical protein
VLNSTAVLRLNFCAKQNICASISATSPSCKTLAAIPKKRQDNFMNTIINLYLIIGFFLIGTLLVMGYVIPHTLRFFRYPRIYKQALFLSLGLLIIGIFLQFFENHNCDERRLMLYPLCPLIFLLLYKITDNIALRKLNRHMYYLTMWQIRDEESAKSTLIENVVQYSIFLLSIYIPTQISYWAVNNWYSC